MDDALYFSEQHLATREMVRQFARDEVAPVDLDPSEGGIRAVSRHLLGWGLRGAARHHGDVAALNPANSVRPGPGS